LITSRPARGRHDVAMAGMPSECGHQMAEPLPAPAVSVSRASSTYSCVMVRRKPVAAPRASSRGSSRRGAEHDPIQKAAMASPAMAAAHGVSRSELRRRADRTPIDAERHRHHHGGEGQLSAAEAPDEAEVDRAVEAGPRSPRAMRPR
jgi:hypothetical protein